MQSLLRLYGVCTAAPILLIFLDPMAKAKAKAKVVKPVRSPDVPVTQRMLYLVRDELKADVKEVRGEIQEVRGEIKQIRGEIKGLKGEIEGVKGSIQSLEGRLTSEIHRLALLMEEQNARNIYVLDGLTNLFGRQERLEQEMAELRRDKAHR